MAQAISCFSPSSAHPPQLLLRAFLSSPPKHPHPLAPPRRRRRQPSSRRRRQPPRLSHRVEGWSTRRPSLLSLSPCGERGGVIDDERGIAAHCAVAVEGSSSSSLSRGRRRVVSQGNDLGRRRCRPRRIEEETMTALAVAASRAQRRPSWSWWWRRFSLPSPAAARAIDPLYSPRTRETWRSPPSSASSRRNHTS